MPDATDPATPADAGGTPPVGDTPDAPPAGDNAAPAVDAQSILKELRDTRREAAGYRTRLKEYEDAQKTETEKSAERIKELETQNTSLLEERRATRTRDAALAAARKAGFWDPEVGASLVNPSDIAFDEAGNPKNMDALVSAIAKDKPRLINGAGAPDFGGGPRGAPPSGADMDTLIRQAAGRR